MSKKGFDYELFAKYKTTPPGKMKSFLEGQLILGNMPFVKNQAARFAKRTAIDIDMDDLLQAGAIGLMLGLRKYDPEKARASTYVAWWVLREMQGCASKTVQVRRPKSAGLSYPKWREFEAFRSMIGEDPTDEDLALPEGSIDAWKQTPVFFPIEEEQEERSPALTDSKEDAEGILMAEERHARLLLAVSLIPADEMNNFRRVSRGLRGNTERAEKTLEALRLFLEDF